MLIGSAALLVVLVISLIGAGGFTKVNVPLFVIQFGAIAFGAMSLFFGGERSFFADDGDVRTRYAIHTWSVEKLKEMFAWDYTVDSSCGGKLCSFHVVFAIIFPAATGIMEGANPSGDLVL